MKLKKNILSFFVIAGMLLLVSATDNKVPAMVKWVILKECTVRVNGSTNINKFSCSIPDYLRSDTLVCYRNGNDAPVVLSGRLELPVLSFDCMSKMMTNDLRKTLKAKEFPSLNIYFHSLGKYPALTSRQEPITGVVSIELAGVSKKYEISFHFSAGDQKVIRLTGTHAIHFSDFSLTPPRKLGGMIRADDRLDVSFQINFRKLNEAG